MSNVGRMLVAKTSNAEYIVGVSGDEKNVSFEPGGRKQKYDFRFVISTGTRERQSPPVVSFGIKNENAKD